MFSMTDIKIHMKDLIFQKEKKKTYLYCPQELGLYPLP